MSRVSFKHVFHGDLAAPGRSALDPQGIPGHAVDVVRTQGLHLRLPSHRHYAIAPAFEGLECLRRASGRHVPRQTWGSRISVMQE